MAVYTRLDLTNKQSLVFQGIEVTGGKISKGNLTINVIFIYCPPKQASVRNIQLLIHNLVSIFHFKENTVILGDFNIDILENSYLETMMVQFGFFPKVREITTDYKTSLDQIFVNFDHPGINYGVQESYYSDHKPIFISIPILIDQ